MGFSIGVSWMELRGCRVGVVVVTIAGVVGHNPVGMGSQKATKRFWWHQRTLVDGWGRPQRIDRVSEQHDWVVGVGLCFSSRRGSANQFSTSCDQIKGDLIEQLL